MQKLVSPLCFQFLASFIPLFTLMLLGSYLYFKYSKIWCTISCFFSFHSFYWAHISIWAVHTEKNFLCFFIIIIFSASFSLIPFFRSSSFRQLFDSYINNLVFLLVCLFFTFSHIFPSPYLFYFLGYHLDSFSNPSIQHQFLLIFYFQNSLLFSSKYLQFSILNLRYYQLGGLLHGIFWILECLHFI